MKILVIQNKMGIGDMVIYLPFIKSISKKFSCPITLLVKESTKADQYLNRASYIDEIIYLKTNNNKNDKHDGFVGSIKLSIELKNKSKYVYFTGSFYSFAKLLLYFFDIDVEDIHYTSLYFFCKRCLEENPEDRVFLFV